MSNVCFNCNKGKIFGSWHRHHPGIAGRQHLRRTHHTPKLFMPNLHSVYLTVDGKIQKIRLCTSCKRTYKEKGLIRSWVKPVKTETNKPVVNDKTVKPAIVKEEKIKKQLAKVEKMTAVVKKSEKPKTKKKETVSIEDIVGKK